MPDHPQKLYPSVTRVTDAERISMVKEIFSTIPAKYDFLNRLLSFRRDVAWRRFTAKKMCFFHTFHLLDVATGTADLAIEIAYQNSLIKVTGIDLVREMIDVGSAKITKHHLKDKVNFLQCDVLDLPFPDNKFDVAAIAFGIRNIPDKIRALKEMERIVYPGGQVMILEFNLPRRRLFKGMYSLFLRRILPYLARPFSKNPAAYHYLAESIMHFPSVEGVAQLMEEAGLTNIKQFPMTLGVTYLHTGIKPE